MPKNYVQLTEAGDPEGKVLVNLATVKFIRPTPQGGSRLLFDKEIAISVVEAPEQITALSK